MPEDKKKKTKKETVSVAESQTILVLTAILEQVTKAVALLEAEVAKRDALERKGQFIGR